MDLYGKWLSYAFASLLSWTDKEKINGFYLYKNSNNIVLKKKSIWTYTHGCMVLLSCIEIA